MSQYLTRDRLRIVGAGMATFGPWAEFGVATGLSAKQFLSVMPQDHMLYLFDSFKGIPEAWDKGNSIKPKGWFACTIPTFDDDRAVIVEGLFEDTLPFDFGGPLGLCHIDSDLYSSAATVLERVELIPGSVLMFDELNNEGEKPSDEGHYPNWREGEYKAFMEWRERTGLDCKWLYHSIGSVVGIVE